MRANVGFYGVGYMPFVCVCMIRMELVGKSLLYINITGVWTRAGRQLGREG